MNLDPVNAHTRVSLFVLERVEKTSMPDSGDGQSWYRYVLRNGRSTITGQRKGTLKDVVAYAKRCAEQINTRQASSQSVWSPRRKKVT